MLEGATRSEDGFNASGANLAIHRDEERMTTSLDAYPTEPRILVACSLIGVQAGIIGIGRRAIRDKRQAAREKCCKYS